MKKFNIAKIRPEMILAKDILDESNNVVLLKSGTVLTEVLIDLLRERGITFVHIMQEKNALCQNYHSKVKAFRSVFEEARYSQKIRVNELHAVALGCFRDFICRPHSFSILKKLATKDNYTFEHSINVGILAGLMAQWLGFSKKEIHEAVLAGLFHDIGKSQIPLSILNKPGKLTSEEMAIMQQHSALGYDLVAGLDDIPLAVKMCSLQHHERNNGCGYPKNLEAEEIHKFAKIVAVADVYDAITSNRSYRKKATPFAAVKIIEDELGKLDPVIGTVFVLNIRDYLIGSSVVLNTNECAEVVCWNKSIGSLPILLTTEKKQYIDLNTESDYKIIALV